MTTRKESQQNNSNNNVAKKDFSTSAFSGEEYLLEKEFKEFEKNPQNQQR